MANTIGDVSIPHATRFVAHDTLHLTSSSDARASRADAIFNTVLAVLAVLAALLVRAFPKLSLSPHRLLRRIMRRRPTAAASP
ncbi:hypothetical protein [Methylobacterium radiodurans]|uniref:hypothetical protein n=1 Tax=Methylobacterium radiodurans TaxID=2202828 RepID=UPI0013A5B92C|nr:hypothetical protein [Methylobacterium radiodurans]